MQSTIKLRKKEEVEDEKTTDTPSHYIKMITVNSDVSIQGRNWQASSVHLWAYCTNPTHDVNNVWRLATARGSTSPTLFEQWCRFFYIPQEPDKCKCCETGPMVFHLYPRRLESLTACRCHYKGNTSFSVILSPQVLVRPGFESATSYSADQCSPNWANHVNVKLTNLHFAFSVILD